MKLGKKGFAVTSIIYSMLVLFLALVLLIMSNLASRKILFDKEKNEILNKFDGSTIVLCTAAAPSTQDLFSIDSVVMSTIAGVQATESSPYALGAVYSCDLGDGAKTFYVLKEEGNNVKLIMNENLGSTVAWCKSGNNNSCEGDGAKEYLANQTSGWEKLFNENGTVDLPEGQDIADAMIDTAWDSASGYVYGAPDWMLVNLNTPDEKSWAYWTSTRYSGSASHLAWLVTVEIRGYAYDNVSNSVYAGVRPVITISKDNMSL